LRPAQPSGRAADDGAVDPPSKEPEVLRTHSSPAPAVASLSFQSTIVASAADVLGLTPTDLQHALRLGGSLADLARARGADRSELVSAVAAGVERTLAGTGPSRSGSSTLAVDDPLDDLRLLLRFAESA
jgi:hypothetical protein